jgi:acyl carrier protein
MIDQVRQILRDVLQLGDRADELGADTQLFGVLPELDSMAVVSILTMMEEEYGIQINDDDVSAETFATVGSLSRFLESRI